MKKTNEAFEQLELARVVYEESQKLESKTNLEETIARSNHRFKLFYKTNHNKVVSISGQFKEEQITIERVGE